MKFINTLWILTLAAAGSAQAVDLRLSALYPFGGGVALLGDESLRGF